MKKKYILKYKILDDFDEVVRIVLDKPVGVKYIVVKEEIVRQPKFDLSMCEEALF